MTCLETGLPSMKQISYPELMKELCHYLEICGKMCVHKKLQKLNGTLKVVEQIK